MAQIIGHVFVSAKADGTDAAQVQPSHWNSSHNLVGGNTGSILCRDASDATYGASWVASVAAGQVLTSVAAGTLPAWSASPTLTSVTLASIIGSGTTIGIGGTSSAFPGLKRSGSTLIFRAADDSGDIPIQTSQLIVSVAASNVIGAAATSPNQQLYITGTFVSSGTVSRVLAIDTAQTGVANGNFASIYVASTFNKAGSGTHPLLAGLDIEVVAVGAAAATITNTASLYIAGPMSTAVTGANYVMWIAAGTTVRWGGYGAGAATFDANGNITSVSDARLKTNIRDYTYGLDAVRRLRPVFYRWNADTHLDHDHDYVSFVAQEVEAVLGPTSVGHNEKGYLTLQERAIIGATVRAIQELADRVDRLEMVH